jgi:uncharacterized protein (TIGR00725 family)
MQKLKFVSVIGASKATAAELRMAETVGRELAKHGAAVVCGGLGGIMEAACRGASEEGGLTIGILPGDDRKTANPYIQIPIVSSIGFARNAAVAKTGQAVIAIGGAYGTLSEIAFALQSGIPVIGLNSWSPCRNGRADESIINIDDPAAAVAMALKMIDSRSEVC